MNEIITERSEIIKQVVADLDSMIDGIGKVIDTYKPPLNGERYYTDAELSKRLKVSRRTTQEWRTNGVIDYIQLGGKILYSESAITALMERNYCRGW